MKKFIIPVALVVMGAGAAFATQNTKSNRAAIVDGYRIDEMSGQCINTQQQCSTTGALPCVWSGDGATHLLDEPISSTACGNELFKP